MEINLEKIELVKDRTGVTYKEAKEALEKANGSVVDAIIDIEESAGIPTEEEKVRSFVDNDVVGKVKEAISKGNVSRILVRNKDGEIVLNLPLNMGVLGAFVAPWGMIVGAIAAAGMNCKVEFVNDKGEVTDVNGKVKEQYSKVRSQSEEKFGKVVGSDIVSEVKDKIDDLNIKDKVENFDINKTIETLKEKLGEILPEDKPEDKAEEPAADVSARDEAAPESAEASEAPAAEEEKEEDILIFE